MNSMTKVARKTLLSGVIALTGLSLAPGLAHATGRPYCPGDPPTWAPGGPPSTSFVHWDWNACHNYHYGPSGVVDEDTGVVWTYPTGPIPPAGPPLPPGSPPPPGCPPWATIFSGPAQCGGL
jgi:hypothetical protein